MVLRVLGGRGEWLGVAGGRTHQGVLRSSCPSPEGALAKGHEVEVIGIWAQELRGWGREGVSRGIGI